MRRLPEGLKARGKRYWTAMKALEKGSEMVFTEAESELIVEICRMLDEIDDLGKAIQNDGVLVQGSRGQPVPHPAIAAACRHRLALGRLLGQLNLGNEETIATPASARAKKAADSRWKTHAPHPKRGAAK